mgnify:CR=1 FL=1
MERYIQEALPLIDGIKRGLNPHDLCDEFGILSTNPHDEDENGDGSIVLTLGGPTVYLTAGDTVDFHYHYGEESYDETLSSDPDTVSRVKQFIEETAE